MKTEALAESSDCIDEAMGFPARDGGFRFDSRGVVIDSRGFRFDSSGFRNHSSHRRSEGDDFVDDIAGFRVDPAGFVIGFAGFVIASSDFLNHDGGCVDDVAGSRHRDESRCSDRAGRGFLHDECRFVRHGFRIPRDERGSLKRSCGSRCRKRCSPRWKRRSR